MARTIRLPLSYRLRSDFEAVTLAGSIRVARLSAVSAAVCRWCRPAVSAEPGGAALLPASMLALLPAAMLVATGAPRVKIGAASPPLLTAGRPPAGHFASVVDCAGRSCLDGRWPAAPRTFRTPVSLANGRTQR